MTVRVYAPLRDHKTIRKDVVADVNARIEEGVDALLMLGLPHTKQMPWDDRERHWLQLNGLVLDFLSRPRSAGSPGPST